MPGAHGRRSDSLEMLDEAKRDSHALFKRGRSLIDTPGMLASRRL
jgi:hypothetical protein